MTIFLAASLWVMIIVLIVLLWNFARMKEQINRIEVEQEIMSFTLARLSKTFLPPASPAKREFTKHMEH